MVHPVCGPVYVLQSKRLSLELQAVAQEGEETIREARARQDAMLASLDAQYAGDKDGHLARVQQTMQGIHVTFTCPFSRSYFAFLIQTASPVTRRAGSVACPGSWHANIPEAKPWVRGRVGIPVMTPRVSSPWCWRSIGYQRDTETLRVEHEATMRTMREQFDAEQSRAEQTHSDALARLANDHAHVQDELQRQHDERAAKLSTELESARAALTQVGCCGWYMCCSGGGICCQAHTCFSAYAPTRSGTAFVFAHRTHPRHALTANAHIHSAALRRVRPSLSLCAQRCRVPHIHVCRGCVHRRRWQ